MLLRVVIRAPQARQQSSSARQTSRHLDQRYGHRSHKICCCRFAPASAKALYACSEHSVLKVFTPIFLDAEAHMTLEDNMNSEDVVRAVPHAVHATC